MLVPLWSGVRRGIDDYRFALFLIGCAFDSSPAFLAYHRSEEVD